MRKIFRNPPSSAITRLALLFMLGQGMISAGCTDNPTGVDKESTAAEKQVVNAANRGVEWLLANQGAMTASRAFSNAHKLYRAVADESLARRLLQVARERYKDQVKTRLVTDFSSGLFLKWKAVFPQVKGLIKSQCQPGSGSPPQDASTDAENTRKLADHVRTHGASIIGHLPLNNRVVAAFFLNELDIDCCNFFEDAVSEVRYLFRHPDQSSSNPGISDLYALTHVIFTRSGYYERYLDKGQYQIEADALELALLRKLGKNPSDIEIDITAEMVVAQKLLGVAGNETTQQVRIQLASLQNPDGSWGRSHAAGRRVHHTLVSVLALIEFAQPFRGVENILCVP